MNLRLIGALAVVAFLLFELTRTVVHYAFLAIAAYSYPLIDPVDQRIYIPSSEETMTRLLLQSTAGQITLRPGVTEILSGTVRYNVAEFAPIVQLDVDGTRSQVLMRPRHDLDPTRLISPGERINNWDLQVGTVVPMRSLGVQLGVGQFTADLAGITAEKIELFVGTGEIMLTAADERFEAEELAIAVGTGNVHLDLRHSVVTSVTADVGLGDILLDLRSDWPQGGTVQVANGMGNAVLILPDAVGVEVRVANGVGETTAPEFVRLEADEGESGADDGTVYVNAAYKDGSGGLHIVVDNGVGNVDLLTHMPEQLSGASKE